MINAVERTTVSPHFERALKSGVWYGIPRGRINVLGRSVLCKSACPGINHVVKETSAVQRTNVVNSSLLTGEHDRASGLVR